MRPLQRFVRRRFRGRPITQFVAAKDTVWGASRDRRIGEAHAIRLSCFHTEIAPVRLEVLQSRPVGCRTSRCELLWSVDLRIAEWSMPQTLAISRRSRRQA